MQKQTQWRLLLLLIGLSGCGGGVTGVVRIHPDRVTLTTGQQQVFSVTITQCTDTQVVWSVQEGNIGGTINSDGVYTAPPDSGVYHVEAECTSDPRVNSTAEVTVN